MQNKVYHDFQYLLTGSSKKSKRGTICLCLNDFRIATSFNTAPSSACDNSVRSTTFIAYDFFVSMDVPCHTNYEVRKMGVRRELSFFFMEIGVAYLSHAFQLEAWNPVCNISQISVAMTNTAMTP